MLEENWSKHCRNKFNAAKRIAGEQSASDMFGGSVMKAKKHDTPPLPEFAKFLQIPFWDGPGILFDF